MYELWVVNALVIAQTLKLILQSQKGLVFENPRVTVLKYVDQNVTWNIARLCRIELRKLMHQITSLNFALILFQLLFKLVKVVSLGEVNEVGAVVGLY